MKYNWGSVTLAHVATAAASAQVVVDGWTVFEPEPNQKIVYVSGTLGNDEGQDAGVTYTWATSHQQTFGSDPFEPDQTQVSIKPYKTHDEAYAKLDDGEPGWILLRKGEHWNEEWLNPQGPLELKSGPEPTTQEPNPGWMLIGAYSDDTSSSNRPSFTRIRVGQGTAPLYSIAIVGVEVTAPETQGIYLNRPGGPIHIEDVLIPAGRNSGIMIQNNHPETTDLVDVRIRRSIVYGRFPTEEPDTGHVQGMRVNHAAGVLIEECILWHNGWAEPGNCPWVGECPSVGDGQATIHNQNVYLGCDSTDATIRRNISADASNVGFHHRVDGLNENNLYLRNNIGLHVGPAGSSDDPEEDSCA